MVLIKNQVCQYIETCPHATHEGVACKGTLENRNEIHICPLVDKDGNFAEEWEESNYDKIDPGLEI